MPLDEIPPGDGAAKASEAKAKATKTPTSAKPAGSTAAARPTFQGIPPLGSDLYCEPAKPTASSFFMRVRSAIRSLNRRRAELFKRRAETITVRTYRVVLPPRTSKQTRTFLADKVEYVEKTTTILLTVHSLGLLLLTYRGVSVPMLENGGGLLQKGEALALAATIAVLSWLGWKYIFSLVPHLRGRRLLAGVSGAALYLSALVAMDAQFVMVGISGSAATKLSMEAVAASYEQHRPVAMKQIAFMRQMQPAFRAQEERFKKAEQDEIKGKGTGLPGSGKVSAAYGQTAKQLTTLNEGIDRALNRGAAIEREFSQAIARINKLIHQQSPIAQRAEAISNEVAKLDELLAELAQLNMAPSILATLKVLETSTPEPIPPKNKVEELQNAEIEIIRKTLGPVAEALRATVREISGTAIEPPPRVRPIDPMTATRVFWRELITFWIASGFVDIAPALLLLILIAAQRQVDAEKTTNKRAGQ